VNGLLALSDNDEVSIVDPHSGTVKKRLLGELADVRLKQEEYNTLGGHWKRFVGSPLDLQLRSEFGGNPQKTGLHDDGVYGLVDNRKTVQGQGRFYYYRYQIYPDSWYIQLGDPPFNKLAVNRWPGVVHYPYRCITHFDDTCNRESFQFQNLLQPDPSSGK